MNLSGPLCSGDLLLAFPGGMCLWIGFLVAVAFAVFMLTKPSANAMPVNLYLASSEEILAYYFCMLTGSCSASAAEGFVDHEGALGEVTLSPQFPSLVLFESRVLSRPRRKNMLCACSGEQFKFEDPPQSPQSLATRDFSASGLSSRTGDWDSKFEDTQVDEVESTLKEALSLNYEVNSIFCIALIQ